MTKPEKIRARIWAQPIRRRTCRVCGRPPRKVEVHWYMQITDGKKVIGADDCRDFGKLLKQTLRAVEEFRIGARRGAEYPDWYRLVEKAVI